MNCIKWKMMIEDITKDSEREEDLFCIFNTIALFLEHQNFTKTYETFRCECESRGLKRKSQSRRNFLPVEDELKEGNQEKLLPDKNAVDSVSNSKENCSKRLSAEEQRSAQITYVFEDEKCQKICNTASSCNTGDLHNIQSRVSVEDYLHLKEKFLDLQGKHRSLMDELDEKTRYLDHIIPLIEVENIQNLSNQNNASLKSISRMDELNNGNTLLESTSIKNSYDNKYAFSPVQDSSAQNIAELPNFQFHQFEINDPMEQSETLGLLSQNDFFQKQRSTLNSSSSRNEFVQTNSADTIPATLSTSNLTTSSEYSLLALSTTEIIPKDGVRTHEAEFLFPVKKCQEVHSAPVQKNEKIFNNSREEGINRDHRHTKCFSMPLSPRKSLLDNQYFELDFSRLKRDLEGGLLEQKLLLLQALRWRLTKCSSIERGSIIESYGCNDILDLNAQKSILDCLCKENIEVNLVEAVARLINAIASLKQGRDYLCSSKKVIKQILIPRVRKEVEKSPEISIYMEILIVTLQKLSIRKEQRKVMIQCGLLQTISHLLSGRRSELTSYCLEYSCALFMNLCLEDEAKVKCAMDPAPIMKVFYELLDGVQDTYMPYISGALYSILSEHAVREEALRQQIDLLIFQQMKNTKDKYSSKQLEFIIRSRFRGEGANFTCSENEPSEEIDLLEPELDQNDTVTGRIQGESLLETYKKKDKPLTGGSKERQTSPIEKITSDNKHTSPIVSSLDSSTSTTTGNTTIDSNGTPKKITASKIKFDAEVSTDGELEPSSKMAVKNSLMEYSKAFPPSGAFTETLGTCNCLGPAKYNCGCYEAIKKSVEEDEDNMFDFLPKDTKAYINTMSGKRKSSGPVSLFSAPGSGNSKSEKCSPPVPRSRCKDS